MFEIFTQFNNLFVLISEKKDGSMKLLPEDSGNFARNKENREIFLTKRGISAKNVISAEIIHGKKVEAVGVGDCDKVILGADGLLTKEKGIFLSVTIADCLPVFFYESQKQVVGILHAGWRGLEKDIIQEAIGKMEKIFGCEPQKILAGIGPAICAKHFEVGEEVAEPYKMTDKYKSYGLEKIITEENNKIFLDLKAIAKFQLMHEGLLERNIEINPECVFELPEKYFSFRRDNEKEVSAMLAIIGMER
jgi:YfiH family protein